MCKIEKAGFSGKIDRKFEWTNAVALKCILYVWKFENLKGCLGVRIMGWTCVSFYYVPSFSLILLCNTLCLLLGVGL